MHRTCNDVYAESHALTWDSSFFVPHALTWDSRFFVPSHATKNTRIGHFMREKTEKDWDILVWEVYKWMSNLNP